LTLVLAKDKVTQWAS